MTQKNLDIKEFVEQGYLQELNRRFLHPLGLALKVERDNTGNYALSGIWDSREDLEGITYSSSSEDLLAARRKKSEYISAEEEKRREVRQNVLGYWIQPLE